MDLTFCITCMNRFYQIKRTLLRNLNDNRKDQKRVNFVLVDFNSSDGLRKYVLKTFQDDLKSGYLNFFFTESLKTWHASIAKNTSHRLATGKIVVNLDCDNFTGYRGGMTLIQIFKVHHPKRIIVQQKTDELAEYSKYGKYKKYIHASDMVDLDENNRVGNFGRISCYKSHFMRIGGYDEEMLPMGYQDCDLIERLSRIHNSSTVIQWNNHAYNRAIPNNKKKSIEFCKRKVNWSEMNLINERRSLNNIIQDKLCANCMKKQIGVDAVQLFPISQ